MSEYPNIGERIHDIRIKRGITQEELAEKADLSVPYISYIERSVKKPSLDMLIRIADALNVTVDSFLLPEKKTDADAKENLNRLLSECSDNEQDLVYELSDSLIRILRENGWIL